MDRRVRAGLVGKTCMYGTCKGSRPVFCCCYRALLRRFIAVEINRRTDRPDGQRTITSEAHVQTKSAHVFLTGGNAQCNGDGATQ